LSRIGKLPIDIPSGISVELDGSHVTVKGTNGTLERSFSPLINIAKEGERIIVTRDSDEKHVRALHGTTRAVIQNMVTGIHVGFTILLGQGIQFSYILFHAIPVQQVQKSVSLLDSPHPRPR